VRLLLVESSSGESSFETPVCQVMSLGVSRAFGIGSSKTMARKELRFRL
jgi:hypothetical protein